MEAGRGGIRGRWGVAGAWMPGVEGGHGGAWGAGHGGGVEAGCGGAGHACPWGGLTRSRELLLLVLSLTSSEEEVPCRVTRDAKGDREEGLSKKSKDGPGTTPPQHHGGERHGGGRHVCACNSRVVVTPLQPLAQQLRNSCLL